MARGAQTEAQIDAALAGRPLMERKRRLHAVMPGVESRLLYVDHIHHRGVALFEAARGHDLQGMVGKWRHADQTDHRNECNVCFRQGGIHRTPSIPRCRPPHLPLQNLTRIPPLILRPSSGAHASTVTGGTGAKSARPLEAWRAVCRRARVAGSEPPTVEGTPRLLEEVLTFCATYWRRRVPREIRQFFFNIV